MSRVLRNAPYPTKCYLRANLSGRLFSTLAGEGRTSRDLLLAGCSPPASSLRLRVARHAPAANALRACPPASPVNLHTNTHFTDASSLATRIMPATAASSSACFSPSSLEYDPRGAPLNLPSRLDRHPPESSSPPPARSSGESEGEWPPQRRRL